MGRLLAVVGVLAALAAAMLAMAAGPAEDVGADITATAESTPSTTREQPAVAPDASPTSPAPSTTGPVDAPSASPTPPEPTVTTDPTPVVDVATRSARIGQVATAAPPARPARLVVPAIGVDAPVGPVGVEPDGQMTVPEDVAELGWYRHGPVPGAPGSAVIAGHVDSRTQGRGVFFDLDRLTPGDTVEVVDEDGGSTDWVVTGRQVIDKVELPVEEVFRRDGVTRLVLITCGGAFDGDARSYRSNVVVTVEPRS